MLKQLFPVLIGFALASSGPFAAQSEELQKPAATEATPIVVFVFDRSCKLSCNTVRPVLKELETEYQDRVQFVQYDVSKETIKEARQSAKSLGVLSFLDDHEEWYPAVGVFSSKRKLVKQILGAKPRDAYREAIEKSLALK